MIELKHQDTSDLCRKTLQREAQRPGQTCGDGFKDQGGHLAAVHQAHLHVAARLHPGHHLQPLQLAGGALRVDQVQTACMHQIDVAQRVFWVSVINCI